MSDLGRYIADLLPKRVITKVEVNVRTLDALRRTGAQPPSSPVSGVLGSLGAAIFVDAEVPDGQARVTWSDGVVEMIGRSYETACSRPGCGQPLSRHDFGVFCP